MAAVSARTRLPKSRIVSRNKSREIQPDVKDEIGVDVPPSPQLVYTSGKGDGSIRGLASLGDELFLVCRGSREVEVYDLEKFTLQRRLLVDGLRGPCDMVSSDRCNALFILDYSSGCVFRVEPTGTATSWPVYDDPWSLSVTNQPNSNSIIVSFYFSSKVKEFTEDGCLIREINLRQKIRYPVHAVQLPSGQLVVSYIGQEHRVCLVDDAGRVTGSYGGRQGSATGQIRCPSYLAVDPEGNILLADQENNRIISLSPSLTFVKELIPASCGLESAMRMQFDNKRGFLFVGEGKEGRLLVFKI